jgi:hypothetical protein
MLATLNVILRLLGLLCRGHRAVALENLALRQQLAALMRTRKRSKVRTSDRLFLGRPRERMARVAARARRGAP